MLISIDLGGTKTRIATSSDGDKLLDIIEFDTHQDLPKLKAAIREGVQGLVGDKEIEYICLGVPGWVDKKSRTFENIVNYPKLNGKKFEELFDLPENFPNLFVENDANLAGLGEAYEKEVSEFGSLAYLTLSTGVGGVKISNKKICNDQDMFEPGHMIINEDGIYDEVCEQTGCLHSYLSGAMFEKVYNDNPETCESEEVWGEYGSHLATGIINVIAMWDPQVIVIGGSISNKYNLFSSAMFEKLKKQSLFEVPKIIKSKLDGKNGLIGGLKYIKLHKPE